MQGEIHVSVHSCMNDYLRCTKCEVQDRVRKHVIRCTKKRVPRSLIFEALTCAENVLENLRSLIHFCLNVGIFYIDFDFVIKGYTLEGF